MHLRHHLLLYVMLYLFILAFSLFPSLTLSKSIYIEIYWYVLSVHISIYTSAWTFIKQHHHPLAFTFLDWHQHSLTCINIHPAACVPVIHFHQQWSIYTTDYQFTSRVVYLHHQLSIHINSGLCVSLITNLHQRWSICLINYQLTSALVPLPQHQSLCRWVSFLLLPLTYNKSHQISHKT